MPQRVAVHFEEGVPADWAEIISEWKNGDGGEPSSALEGTLPWTEGHPPRAPETTNEMASRKRALANRAEKAKTKAALAKVTGASIVDTCTSIFHIRTHDSYVSKYRCTKRSTGSEGCSTGSATI
jgi:hypothetical protein